MRAQTIFAGMFLLTTLAFCETPSASEIMHRVAQNQDRLQKERAEFVYDQTIHVVSRHGNGKVICEQTSQYVVVPKEKGSESKLVSTEGKYWHKGGFVNFRQDLSANDETLDTGLVKSFRDDFTLSDSKDGISQDLFPLTSAQQEDLEFELKGERVVAGRPAYIVRFRPKDHSEIGWAGEAVIDQEEFQPITVYTKLSRKLPLLVRTMLGTDVPGLGFTTQYTRVDKDVWFPSGFGTEFKVNAVFFFHRAISVSLENKNFQRASVDAQIHYDASK